MKCTSAAVKGMMPLSARACSAGVRGAADCIPLFADCCTLLAHAATPHARIPASATDRGCFLMIGPPPVLDAFDEGRTHARPQALARTQGSNAKGWSGARFRRAPGAIGRRVPTSAEFHRARSREREREAANAVKRRLE